MTVRKWISRKSWLSRPCVCRFHLSCFLCWVWLTQSCVHVSSECNQMARDVAHTCVRLQCSCRRFTKWISRKSWFHDPDFGCLMYRSSRAKCGRQCRVLKVSFLQRYGKIFEICNCKNTEISNTSTSSFRHNIDLCTTMSALIHCHSRLNLTPYHQDRIRPGSVKTHENR